ncbi:unnamed protein product, partial [Closterium sp. NIES-54]
MAAQELRWLTYLLTDLGEAPRSPLVLYVDNKAMLALCQEHRLEHRTKHIALRYFLARELQQRGQLRLAYVASQANTADVFTKALQASLAVLFDFYRQHFHLLAASAAVQWITMQGCVADSDSELRAKRERLLRARKARRARRISEWMDDLQVMEDDDFINMFRISREVLAEITPAMAHPMSHFVDRYGIPVEMCCLIPI